MAATVNTPGKIPSIDQSIFKHLNNLTLVAKRLPYLQFGRKGQACMTRSVSFIATKKKPKNNIKMLLFIATDFIIKQITLLHINSSDHEIILTNRTK